MIASIQITNTEIFAFISAVKFCLLTKNTTETVKQQISQGNYCKIMNS